MSGGVAVVTGATGCLGRALVSHLVRDGVTVRAVSRNPRVEIAGAQSIAADIRDDDALAAAFRDADVVFHLAAYAHDLRSTDDTAHQQAITLGGTVAALAAAKRTGIAHFVFASSLAVYGTESADDESPCEPRTPYGRAKRTAERAVSAFAEETGACASSIRPAMIYGIGCRGNLPRMIRAVRARLFPPIPEFGNRRSMISDADAAASMVRAWRANVRGGRTFIVTDGVEYSTRQIYDAILRAMGRTPASMTIPRGLFAAAAACGDLGARVLGRRMPFDTQALDRLAGSAYFTTARAERELGYRRTTTLSDVLPAIIRDIEDNARGSRRPPVTP